MQKRNKSYQSSLSSLITFKFIQANIQMQNSSEWYVTILLRWLNHSCTYACICTESFKHPRPWNLCPLARSLEKRSGLPLNTLGACLLDAWESSSMSTQATFEEQDVQAVYIWGTISVHVQEIEGVSQRASRWPGNEGSSCREVPELMLKWTINLCLEASCAFRLQIGTATGFTEFDHHCRFLWLEY